MPPLGGPLAAGHNLRPFLTAAAMCASTFSTAFMSISGPITATRLEPVDDLHGASGFARSLVKAS
jgi:hypothetical protein